MGKLIKYTNAIVIKDENKRTELVKTGDGVLQLGFARLLSESESSDIKGANSFVEGKVLYSNVGLSYKALANLKLAIDNYIQHVMSEDEVLEAFKVE